MTYSFLPPGSNGFFVDEGETVIFQYTAPATWDTTESVTIRIGDLTQIWFIVTIPEDFSPDNIVFNTYNDADLNTLYTYADGTRSGENLAVISGLTPGTQAPISTTSPFWSADINNFAVRIDPGGSGTFGPWIIADGSQTVQNDDVIQVRLRSSLSYATEVYINVTIGTANFRWRIRTQEEPNNVPIPFPEFTNLFNQPVSTLIYSNILQITGLSESTNATVSVGEILVSPTNTTTTLPDGQERLDPATIGGTVSVQNGDFIQLRLTSAPAANLAINATLGIGDEPTGSIWTVQTGAGLSTSINPFTFTNATDVIPFTQISSGPEPGGGITGLGTGISVPVTLVDALTDNPANARIKINGGSIGLFPASVQNGDLITIYNESGDYGDVISTVIDVGGIQIAAWFISTALAPDSDPTFTPPPDLNNRAPGTAYNSSPIGITGINIPIDIDADAGALISIDFDTFAPGPRTFDPLVNTNFRVQLISSFFLNTSIITNVTLGDGSFTWTISTYAVAPPPPTFVGTWYSKKTEKYDGYPIGTILPILKENINTGANNFGYGDLAARYPGFVECDGSSYQVTQYPDLWWSIGNQYGGSGNYDESTKTYSGSFNVPDYRNRRLCGNGRVDGNLSASPFAPANISAVGGEGGYWYVDSVSVAGSDPFEQIQGAAEGDSSGLTSFFFELGAPKTIVLEDPQIEIDFAVQGTVSATIGPILDEFVAAPPHSHFVMTSVVENEGSVDGGDPLIIWGEPSMVSLPNNGVYANSIDPGPFATGREDESADSGDAVQPYIGQLGTWGTNYRRVDQTAVDTLDDVVTSLTTTGSNEQFLEVAVPTWFMSPANSIPNSPLFELFASNNNRIRYGQETTTRNGNSGSISGQSVNWSGGGAAGGECVAVIDTEPSTFRISSYTSQFLGGDWLSHSHFISDVLISNIFQDYSYGNEGSYGQKNGLVSGAATKIVTFDQEGNPEPNLNVQNELTEGVFVLNDSVKKPVPTVAFSPQREVPLVPPFHKTKYIIKAF